MIEHKKKFNKSDRKINKKNMNLMIDKILSYNPMLHEGIEVYKDANRNFMLLICLGVLLINYPLISVPCCILSMFFIIKMLEFVKYKSINNIVKELAKDVAYKGIYDKEKAIDMLDDFKAKYGEDAIEYDELINMINKYEALVTKIEYVLRNIMMDEKKSSYDKESFLSNEEKSYTKNENYTDYKKSLDKKYKGRDVNSYYTDINGRASIIYRNRYGEVKKVNKAIEFFEEEKNEASNNENTVILKNINKENKNLTVYLYKKSSAL